MASDISLSSATRSNLLSLQRTTDLVGRTQDRLSTGKKVNSAIDDALSFFTARSLNDRASDLTTLKSGIEEGIQVLTTTTDALTSVEDVLKQMKAVASSAKATASTDTATRESLAKQYNELRGQIDTLVADASYNGVNLIKSDADTLTVKFSEQDSTSDKRRLEISGKDTDSTSLSVGAIDTAAEIVSSHAGAAATQASNATWLDTNYETNASDGVTHAAVAARASASGIAWAATQDYQADIQGEIDKIDTALKTVRSNAQEFGINASMLQIRNEFTDNLVNTLESGAASLVNADLNEESANMLSLQTRQQLGSIALSIAQQSEQSILRLF